MVMSAVSSVGTGRSGHRDTTLVSGRDVDIVDAAELAISLNFRRPCRYRRIDAVGQSYQHAGRPHGSMTALAHRLVIKIKSGIEQLAHARLDAPGSCVITTSGLRDSAIVAFARRPSLVTSTSASVANPHRRARFAARFRSR